MSGKQPETITPEEFKRLQEQESGKGKKRKFYNSPTTVDGIRFDSKREAQRYSQLVLLEKSGEIRHLQLKPKFHFVVNGHPLDFTYTADFHYWDCKKSQWVTEDVKREPTKTQQYKLRRELVFALYGVVIQEV